MKIEYIPHRFGKPSKSAIKKYEKSLEAIEIYIENLVTSHADLLNQVDVDKAEHALEYGLIQNFDVSHGNDIDVATHIRMYSRLYIEDLIKRAYQMGVCSGDTKGAGWALNEARKLESNKNSAKRSKPNISTEKIRRDIEHLISQDFKDLGEEIKYFKLERYVNKYKDFLATKDTHPTITDQTIKKHIKKIREEILQKSDKSP